MKKLFATMTACLVCLSMSAQLTVKVKSMERIPLPDNYLSGVQTLSPDGSFVVVTDGATIDRLDLTTQKLSRIAAAGEAYDLRVSPDGETVVYNEPSFSDQLRYVSLKSAPTAGGDVTTIVAPSRHLNAGVSLRNNSINAVEAGKLRTAPLGKRRSATAEPVVSINYGHLDVTVNGVTTTLDPQGRGSYLWPALSPDGTKIVYWSCGDGCFVCDIDGSNVRYIGMIRAAVWAGDDMLVGMDDEDDGRVVTASRLVASDLSGHHVTLTADPLIAMYPSASASGHRVAFSTGDAIYILNLEK